MRCNISSLLKHLSSCQASMIYLFDLITQINIKTWRLWNIAFFYLSMKQKKIFWPGYLHVTLLYMILSMTHLKWMKHHGLCQVFNIVFWGMPVVWLIIPLFETIFWSFKQKCLYFCTPGLQEREQVCAGFCWMGV